ncbi:hypothetical protein JOC78_003379 [Bacillus ectoiniformans]|uniref:hypothetical protein n=1 Tax=Bacillus ectoiniformans TaxID=1494429 RepID=UPI001EF9A7A4|nr:hypothetical protein [Bacillus ectoiniformans]MBM7650389.1 hypothetical protein [Bacillus ectoiniformans]
MNYQCHGTPQSQVLYQADCHFIQQLRPLREHLHNICRRFINQRVRVQTIDGLVYEGTIVNCDRGLLYLRVENPEQYGQRSNDFIIYLVLYELLIITLLLLY